MRISEDVRAAAERWLRWDKNESTRAEIDSLLTNGDEAALKSRMDGKLSFGTAGIRAKMGAGFYRLNDLTIIQISQGMALYLRSEMAREGREHSGGIAIGFDGRYNSRRFSELAANVFTQNGMGVYLFSDVVPTPVVSFATADLKCDAGLMITASHNPKEDNGYKVYWRNGAQIIAPHDVEICRFMAENAEPKDDSYWELSRLHSSPLLKSADCCLERYFDSESRMCFQRSMNEQTSLNFTYSAFHGVGSRFATEMFRRYGIRDERVHHVALQDEPDPSFPTVPFPNPEEGVRVLKLCVETANETSSRIILANDPDADRLQMAERQSDGEWRIFTGNEMGAVLTWWIWTNWQRANPGADLSKVYILTSAVSSQIVQTMAAEEGFRNAITLTGFKWMGNLADDLRKGGNEVILAWEESIGFMAGSTLDKDGISAAAIFAEISIALHAGGRRVSDQLYEIYREYGFHLVRSSYWIVPTPLVTKCLFTELRQSYPAEIDGKEVKYVRDLTTGFDNSQLDNKAVLPISTSSEMITFTLDTGSTITLRASGTEPKIKYYIELKTEKGKRPEDLSWMKKELDDFEEKVVQSLLRPAHYGLKHRDSH